jgi:hypothetical protein
MNSQLTARTCKNTAATRSDARRVNKTLHKQRCFFRRDQNLSLAQARQTVEYTVRALVNAVDK